MVVNGEPGTHLAAQAWRLKHLRQGAFSEALNFRAYTSNMAALKLEVLCTQNRLTKVKVHTFIKHLNPTIFLWEQPSNELETNYKFESIINARNNLNNNENFGKFVRIDLVK